MYVSLSVEEERRYVSSTDDKNHCLKCGLHVTPFVYIAVPSSKMEWTSTSFHFMQQQSASFRPLQKLPPFWFMSTWRRIFKEFLRFETSLRLSLCFRNFATTCGGKGKLFFNMLMVNSLMALIWSLLACKSFSKLDKFALDVQMGLESIYLYL